MKDGTFTKLFTQGKSSVTTTLASGFNNVKSQAASALLQLNTTLKPRISEYDNIILAFSQTDYLMSGLDQIGDQVDDIIEIETDIGENIINSIKDIDPNGVTITVDGNILDIVPGVDVMTIANKAVIYTLEGKMYINRIIKTRSFDDLGNSIYITIDKLLKSLLESNAINSLISRVSEIVVSGGEALNTLSATLTDFFSSKFSSVRNIATGISSAYSTDGLMGLVIYLRDIYSGLGTLTANVTTNTFEFTDPKSLIPVPFSDGMLETVVTVAGTVVSAVLAYFNPVIGMLGLAATYIGKQIIEAFNSAHMDEYVHINTDESKCLPYLPYVLMRGEVYYDDMPHDLQHAIDDGINSGFVKVAGGYIVWGPRGENSQGTYYGVEFHPDAMNRISFAKQILNYLINQRMLACDEGYGEDPEFYFSSNDYDYYISTMDITWSDGHWTNVLTTIERAMEQEENPMFVPETSGDYAGYIKSVSDEQLLAQIISANCFLFTISHKPWTFKFVAGYNRDVADSYSILVNKSVVGTRHVYDSWILYFADMDTEYYTLPGPNDHNLRLGYHTLFDLWAEVGSYIDNFWETSDLSGFRLWPIEYYTNPVPFVSGSNYPITVPKYTRGSVISRLVAIGVALLAITAVTIYATVSVKRFLAEKRAIASAKVGKAWDDFQNDPTSANYLVYRKSAKSNNRLVSLIGGTKYDLDDYWFGDQFNQDDTSAGVANFATTNTGINQLKFLITGESE